MAYGKIHEQLFDSTVVEHGLEVWAVFVSMIVLSDQEGFINMNPSALARRINTSRDTVVKAIEILSAPDPDSQNPEHGGKRLVPIDVSREWGWQVVSKAHYRDLVDAEEQRKKWRDRQAKSRKAKQDNNPVTRCHAVSRHTDTNTNTDVNTLGQPKAVRESWFQERWQQYPRKERKTDAKKAFVKTVECEACLADFDFALEKWKTQKLPTIGSAKYIPQGGTWFREWETWLEWEPPIVKAARPVFQG